MTWIWLLVARVVQTCEMFMESSRDAALEETSSEDEDSTQLAEIVSAAAAALEEYAPETDSELWAVTVRDGVHVPVNGLRDAGVLVRSAGGQLGLTVGRGMLAMMVAGDLVIIRRPAVAEFVAAYQLPGFKYWKA